MFNNSFPISSEPPAYPEYGQQQNLAYPPNPKFESALDFLERVKTVFEDQPDVYNNFLDVMKEFKAQNINTPVVIQSVKMLFYGHPDLILGFNAFLPYGHKITRAELQQPPVEPPTQPPAPLAQQPPIPSIQQQPAAQPQNRKDELAHARNYVRKIKKRFASEPQIFKAFLEVLHVYHNEQNSMQEVYSNVAKLFKNHKDLLEEFVQFLPDAAASTGQMRVEESQRPPQPDRGDTVEPRAKRIKSSHPGPGPVEEAPTKLLRNQRPPKASPAPEPEAENTSPASTNPATFTELENFIRIKMAIPEHWAEFVKCLQLYNSNVISKYEVLALSRDLLIDHQNLWNSLREFVGVDVDEFSDDEVCLSELDLSGCERNGVSYRKRPKQYKLKDCTGRSSLDNSVLNDDWISRPTGEEGGFKSSRKNEYEELLFKCEDDRFEWDLIAEKTSAAIRALEVLQKEINALPKAEQSKFKILPNSISTLHRITIRNLYGNRGPEMEKMFMEHPAFIIPIVLARLKQKDNEWAIVKTQWTRKWRRLYEDYFLKSLDHEGVNSKYEQKRRLTPQDILEDLNTKFMRRSKDGSSQNVVPEVPDFTITIGNSLVYADARALITTVADRMFSYQDGPRDRVMEMLNVLDSIFSPAPPPQPESAVASTTEISSQTEAGTKSSSDQNPTKPTPALKLFLTDHNLVVLFRFIQILIAQLEKARGFCLEPFNLIVYTPPTHPKPYFDESDDADHMTRPRRETITGNGPEAVERRYRNYLALLTKLVNNQTEQSTYEEICLETLGVKSYSLFSMDRLVVGIGRQMGVIVNDPVSSRLCQLYLYDVLPYRREETNYYSLLATLLSQDDRVFHVSFNSESSEYSISQLDKRWRPIGAPPPVSLKPVVPDTPPVPAATTNSGTSRHVRASRGAASSHDHDGNGSKSHGTEKPNKKNKYAQVEEVPEVRVERDAFTEETSENGQLQRSDEDDQDGVSESPIRADNRNDILENSVGGSYVNANGINCIGAVNTFELTGDEVDPSQLIVPGGGDGVHPDFPQLYRKFVEDPPQPELAPNVYLQRNFRMMSRELGDNAMHDTLSVNQLLFAIDVHTLRPRYVVNTEDIFWRRRTEPLKYRRKPRQSRGNEEEDEAEEPAEEPEHAPTEPANTRTEGEPRTFLRNRGLRERRAGKLASSSSSGDRAGDDKSDGGSSSEEADQSGREGKNRFYRRGVGSDEFDEDDAD